MESKSNSFVKVLSSTDKKKRPFDLVEIASDIKLLVKQYGGMKKVAELVGISAGMLNQFLRVDQLSTNALELVRERKIDSVSVVNSLSKFSTMEQDIITGYVLSGKLNSLELRALLPLRKSMPNESITDLIKKLKSSQNIKVSVIRFHINETKLTNDEIVSRFKSVIGTDNLLTFETEDDMHIVKITLDGEKLARKRAKAQKINFAKFIHKLIS